MQKDLPQPFNQEGARHVNCPFYVECLTYAVDQGWVYWSCGRCRNHLLEPIYERQQYVGQYYSMLAAIYPEFRKKYKHFMEYHYSFDL